MQDGFVLRFCVALKKATSMPCWHSCSLAILRLNKTRLGYTFSTTLRACLSVLSCNYARKLELPVYSYLKTKQEGCSYETPSQRFVLHFFAEPPVRQIIRLHIICSTHECQQQCAAIGGASSHWTENPFSYRGGFFAPHGKNHPKGICGGGARGREQGRGQRLFHQRRLLF